MTGTRFDRLDALRGLAIVWMVLFHFAFDLNHFGLLVPRQRFTVDPFWTTQRTIIVTLFLLCAGMGQAIAVESGQGWRRFWRRWTQVAVCALMVSVGSWAMFPRTYISFGVLHGVAVMLVLLRFGAPLGRWWWAISVVALVLPHWVQHPFFDSRAANWIGLVTRRPLTEDYVPLLPWLGVMGLGFAAGRELLRVRSDVLAGSLPRTFTPLASLGRRPLTIYMLHQPVLIGLVMLYVAIIRAG